MQSKELMNIMDSNNKLKSGNDYSLAELFSTINRKIIIPDFQRDYCWGDCLYGEKGNTDIVSGFIDTLTEEFENNRQNEVLLGKIDVYENPTNHIYLTDGQQRLTTLYLIIGILCKQTKLESLQRCLISHYEQIEDDKEPYLQYSIRESTFFFLRDLVNEFFINENKLKVNDIKKQSWYFNEYNLDPTIISILSALKTIENKLIGSKIDNLQFSVFIISKIKIQYYDVKDRKHGEQRFVIINTTGKGLTVSENVKPILLGRVTKSTYAQQWEERETWFWENKSPKEQIADNGVNNFLTWCFQIIEKQESIDLIKKAKEVLKYGKCEDYLERINQLFQKLQKLIVHLETETIRVQLKFVNKDKIAKGIFGVRELTNDLQQNIIIPLLYFMEKISEEENEVYQFLRRLRKNYFDKERKERNINYLDWRYILEIINMSSTLEEVLAFDTVNGDIKPILNIQLNTWYNEEERWKKKFNKIDKSKIEEIEDHPDFMGDISVFKNKIDENKDSIVDLYYLYTNYNLLYKSFKNPEQEPQLSSFYRLFRILIGCSKVSAFNYCSSDFQGVSFSNDYSLTHFTNSNFWKLCALNQDDTIQYIKKTVTEYIEANDYKELITEENFDHVFAINFWLILKCLNAKRENTFIYNYDGRNNCSGISVYLNPLKNKISSQEKLSYYNYLCGFAVRSPGNYIEYASEEEYWCNPRTLDTPFEGIEIKKFHQNRQSEMIELERNKNYIDALLHRLYN